MKKFQEYVSTELNEKPKSNIKHERKCKKHCDDKDYVNPNDIEKLKDECKPSITEVSRQTTKNKLTRLLSRLNKLKDGEIMAAIRISAEITVLGISTKDIKVSRLISQLSRLKDDEVLQAIRITSKLNGFVISG